MDLWGDEIEPQRPKEKKAKGTPKPKDEPNSAQNTEQWEQDHIAELSEDSSPKSWLIHIYRMLDDIKVLKIRQSEIRDLREYVTKVEKFLGYCKGDIKEIWKEYSAFVDSTKVRLDSIEGSLKDLETKFTQILEALKED